MTQERKRKFLQVPFFVFLLPVFFVLHGYFENFGAIGIEDCFALVITYLAAAITLHLIFYLFYKNHIKAGLITALLLGIYLFFGAIQDFLKGHVRLLYKYSFILPIFLAIIISAVIYLKKTKRDLLIINSFLNLLFFIFLLVDISGIIYKKNHQKNSSLSVDSTAKSNPEKFYDSSQKPDIYFIVFDEYSSTLSLLQKYNYNNRGLDSFLETRGFHILKNSRSNYNITSFSMASILNTSYLPGIKNQHLCTPEDYTNCIKLIRSSEVIQFLSSQNYEILNYSIFDLAGNPSRVEQDFLPLKTRLITAGTLPSRLMKDIGWHLYAGKFSIRWLVEKKIQNVLENNNMFFDKVEKQSKAKSNRPRFIYAHFLMPHAPFFFDKNGSRKKDSVVYEETIENTIEGYLGYIPYTNQRLKELIANIQQNTGNHAVIIFMGDHGFRRDNGKYYPISFFQNQNAIYYPDNDYRSLNDSISGVNEFRIIFNKLFDQKIPLLKDSVILLRDNE